MGMRHWLRQLTSQLDSLAEAMEYDPVEDLHRRVERLERWAAQRPSDDGVLGREVPLL